MSGEGVYSKHAHRTGNNGNMVALGLIWQMDFDRQFSKGEKSLFRAFLVAGVIDVLWELYSFLKKHFS